MKNPNGCTGERCLLVEGSENGCNVTCCPWFTPEKKVRPQPEFVTIYGYSVRDLEIFAEACRIQNVRVEDLHSFVLNLQAAFDVVYKSILQQLDKAIKKAFGTDGTIDQEGER